MVQAAWRTFVGTVEAGERTVPRLCWREVEGFLKCGILAHGLLRVHCCDCGKDDVVAFSCKGRGCCPVKREACGDLAEVAAGDRCARWAGCGLRRVA